MANTDTISLSAIKKAIEFHLGEADKLQNVLNVLQSANLFTLEQDTPPKQNYKSSLSTSAKEFNSLNSVGLTFKEVIKSVFETANETLTAKQTLDLYNKLTNKGLSQKSFSGAFSPLAKDGGILKKITIENNPIETKYYYGLSNWFDGDTLKEEYLMK